jgi:hypothetical protein
MSASQPQWEKSGNVSWVACRECAAWFPVADALVESEAIELVCPHCGLRFKSKDAAAVQRP